MDLFLVIVKTLGYSGQDLRLIIENKLPLFVPCRPT